jgi:hypothetical protein
MREEDEYKKFEYVAFNMHRKIWNVVVLPEKNCLFKSRFITLPLIIISSSSLFLSVHFCRPTLKTINPTSRTHLKTILQRDQLLMQQEAERKEAERKLLQQQQEQKKSESQKVPLKVDVPPQVLQVISIIFFKYFNLK